jgi:hypothetical protein
MATVEESLDFLGHEQNVSAQPLNEAERAQILSLADRLAKPELGYLDRLAVVTQIKRVLGWKEVNGNKVEKMTSEHLLRSLHEASSPSRV